MTEATPEAPTLTEVLVRHGIYSHYGINRIAINDDTLQDLTGTATATAAPRDVTLLEEPGSPAWVDRMVRVRHSSVTIIENLREENKRMSSHLEALGQALLEKAIEKEWCEEYNTFAEEWDLPKCNSEWEVTMTVRVTARNEEAALEIVQDNVSISPYNTEGVSESPDFEASEV